MAGSVKCVPFGMAGSDKIICQDKWQTMLCFLALLPAELSEHTAYSCI
jgi:hypothetical protein